MYRELAWMIPIKCQASIRFLNRWVDSCLYHIFCSAMWFASFDVRWDQQFHCLCHDEYRGLLYRLQSAGLWSWVPHLDCMEMLELLLLRTMTNFDEQRGLELLTREVSLQVQVCWRLRMFHWNRTETVKSELKPPLTRCFCMLCVWTLRPLFTLTHVLGCSLFLTKYCVTSLPMPWTRRRSTPLLTSCKS